MTTVVDKSTCVFIASRAFALRGPRLHLLRHFVADNWKVVAAVSCLRHAEELEAAGVEVLPIEFERQGLNFIRDGIAITKLVRYFLSERPKLIHLFQAKSTLLGGMAACCVPNAKVVNTVTGLGTLFCRRDLIAAFGRFAFRTAMLRSHVTVFQCREDQREIRHQRANRRESSRVIVSSGVDTRKFVPNSENALLPPDVLMASRLLKQKGVQEYVEAAEICKSRMPTSRFALAGDWNFDHPDSVDRQWLQAYIDRGIVEYVGRIDQIDQELPRYSIAALPSHREGTPRFLLEAASCGLPVVTTDVPGCRETVVNGKTGFMVSLNRPDLLAHAISKILMNKPLRQSMGKAGRQRAMEHFDMRIINASYIDLYREIGVDIAPMATGQEEPSMKAA